MGPVLQVFSRGGEVLQRNECLQAANSGRFAKQPRGRGDSRKQPFAFANVVVGIAPNRTRESYCGIASGLCRMNGE